MLNDIGLIVGLFVLYWVIRWGVSAGLRDFEKWRCRRDAEQASEYARFDQHDEQR